MIETDQPYGSTDKDGYTKENATITTRPQAANRTQPRPRRTH